MSEKKVKDKLLNNLGIKILSLILAFFFWVVIVNSQDPVDTRTIEDVPVSIINVEKAELEGTPEVIDEGTVDVVVKARRSICDKLSAENFVATADITKIYLSDSIPVDVVMVGYEENEVEIIRIIDQVIKVKLK